MRLSSNYFNNIKKSVLYKNYSTNTKKRICIVGSGPAGFYAAQYLVNHLPDSYIDIIEKLPVPFGLVRFGVAPDHPEVKNVINTFTKTAENANVRFLGNVNFGQNVTLKQLRENYHAVLLTYGANTDRLLNIPNESKQNVISAREFVAWYNGLPGFENLNPNLQNGDTAAIIGQGNVAMDVARILLSPIELLKKTDITQYAVESLTGSKIKKVYLIGRRGPLQAAFTTKELREMIKLENFQTLWRPNDFDGIAKTLNTLERPRKRLTELMLKSLSEMKEVNNNNNNFAPIFFRSPKKILDNGIELTVTKLDNEIAVNTDEVELIESSLIFRSIGYKSINFDDEINFNSTSGFVNNEFGRVLKKDSNGNKEYENGLYVSGWLGTGPSGVIITTMNNSFTVANQICSDFLSGKVDNLKESKPGLDIDFKEHRIVTWDKWKKIDEAEIKAGTKLDKPREKIVSIEKMLVVAGV